MVYSFMRLFVLAVLIFAPNLAAAEEGKQKIFVVSGSQFAEYIQKTAGKKRIIMIYASWCPYCRKEMPEMMKLDRDYPDSVIAISADESFDDLARFVGTLGDVPFDLFMRKEAEQRGQFEDSLSKFKIKPWSGYPTYIMLKADNTAFSQGYYEHGELIKFLDGFYDR